MTLPVIASMTGNLKHLCEQYVEISFALEDTAAEIDFFETGSDVDTEGGEEPKDMNELYEKLDTLMNQQDEIMRCMRETGIMEDQIHDLLQQMDEKRYGDDI